MKTYLEHCAYISVRFRGQQLKLSLKFISNLVPFKYVHVQEASTAKEVWEKLVGYNC